jgi:hypothetical protein
MRSRRLGLLSVLFITAVFLLMFLLLSGAALAAESWMSKSTGGFGDTSNIEAISMVVYNSQLYVGTYNTSMDGGQGCEIWRYDGAHWTQVVGQDAPGTRGTGPGFGNAANISASSLEVLGSYLYVGTDNYNGCEVWRYDGTSWTQLIGQDPPGTPVTGPGFDNIYNTGIHKMLSNDTYLYVGTNNTNSETGGCEVWRFDGSNWTQMVGQGTAPDPTAPGFGDPSNGCAHSMAFMGSYLYVGTYNFNGCEVWRFDGSNWTQMVGQGTAPDPTAPGFGDISNVTAWSMTEFDGCLYVGTERSAINKLAAQEAGPIPMHGVIPEASELSQSLTQIIFLGSGCQVWRFDGSAWTEVVGQDPEGTPGTGPGFGQNSNVVNSFLVEYNGFLYAGTVNIPIPQPGASLNDAQAAATGGCQVWRFDRSSWTQSNENGFGNINNIEAPCMASFFGTAFVGTGNYAIDGAPISPESTENASVGTTIGSDGCEIWALPYTYYFAEGNTGADYQEYLSVGNPFEDVTAHVNITYLFPDGTSQPQGVDILPNYRDTIDVNGVVGPNKEVSCKLESDFPIAAERPMYFNYHGVWNGGHDAVAADGTATTWYFAEGYTGPVFDEYICILNPQNQTANLTFHFQTQEDGLRDVSGLSVAAHSRGIVKANDILGPNFQTSLKLDSSVPVVVERPMYFDYFGKDELHWPGGDCVMGVTSLSKTYSFAEGTTRTNFDEWLTLQNPGTEAITINAFYQFGAGQGDPVIKSYMVDPGRRYTLFVPEEVGMDRDVSVTLTSSSDFLAERPLYFRYTNNGVDWAGGDCVIGASSPAMDWFFGEGTTINNFQEWLSLENPGDTTAVAEIDYYTQEQGPLPARQVEIPAKSRVTVYVNDNAGPDFQLSTRVKVVSGPAIVAERPMYFLYNNAWSGGHDVVGYTP